MDILGQVISKAVELYHRKIGFWKKDSKKKISQVLAVSLVRSKGSLTLSRAFDIAISNDHQEVDEQNESEDEDRSAASSEEDDD